MTQPLSTSETAERTPLGILFATLAFFGYATSDALIKLLAQELPVPVIMVFHVTFSLIPVGWVLWTRTASFRDLLPRHPLLMVFRGMLGGVGTLCAFVAFSRLRLAEAYAIIFATPILVTILSVPLLGEEVRRYRWTACIVGFVGILVILRPGLAELTSGHLLALGSALTGAFVTIILRRIGREENRGTLLLSLMAGLYVVAVPLAIVEWQWLTPIQLFYVAIAGIVMGTSQFFTIQAVRYAAAGVVAPLQYTMMPWAIAYGWAIFGAEIDPWVLLGSAIIIASSLYILHRERVRGRTLTAHVTQTGTPR